MPSYKSAEHLHIIVLQCICVQDKNKHLCEFYKLTS